MISTIFCTLCLLFLAFARSFQASNAGCRTKSPMIPSETSNFLFKQTTERISTENGIDLEYPWLFTGRLWFRPALVRVPSNHPESEDPRPPPSVSILSIFGWTVGGSVALEYDNSPIGPYREYVTMGAIVFKRGAFGQWGSKLFVSTPAAEDICRKTWNVPAALADIEFSEESSSSTSSSSSISSTLTVESAPDVATPVKQKIKVCGWKATRILKESENTSRRWGGIPLLWTPAIKSLWTPWVIFPSSDGRAGHSSSSIPLHRLRLSATAIRLTLCGQNPSEALGIPIPVGILVDNVLIEISREEGAPL